MDVSQLYEALPQDAAALLEQAGIRSADFEDLFSVQFRDVADIVLGLFRGNLKAPLSFFGIGFGVLLVLSVFSAIGHKSEKGQRIQNFAGMLVLIVSCAVPMYSAVSMAVSAVQSAGIFIRTLIPVLAAVVAAGGNPLLSVCWNTAVFSAAQTVSAVASGFMAPSSGLLIGTGICGILTQHGGLAELSEKIRKASVWIFSSLATLFTAFLSLKGILAGSADSLAAKGIKLAVSSFVPVVGSQLSEAYASVVGSLSAVRSTSAVFAILGLCAIVLPALVQITLWILSLKALSFISVTLSEKKMGDLFLVFSSALSVLFACILFVAVLYILSVGIILKVRNGL